MLCVCRWCSSSCAQRALHNFIPDARFPAEADSFFSFALSQLEAATSDDSKIMWARLLVSVTRSLIAHTTAHAIARTITLTQSH